MDKLFSIPKMTILEWNPNKQIVIDVRSPKEFEEFSFPDSYNIPVFSNDERAVVGTVYKQKGKNEAIKLGLELFSSKIPDLYNAVIQLKNQFPDREIAVTCARGGMRSSSFVSLLNMLGCHSYQLQRGIRSYREFVVDKLMKLTSIPKRFYIVSGNTGTKKTDILLQLKSEGYPVIDLEGLAGHRGSVFGEIGLKARTQKEFEALLVMELQRYKTSPFFIIESESKRIGNIILPAYIINGKEAGTTIELDYPFNDRVEYLLHTYNPSQHHDKFIEAFRIIQKRMQGHIGKEIEEHFHKQNYKEAFGLLLLHYYDPMYKHAASKYQNSSYKIKFTEDHEAIDGVKKIIQECEKSSEILQRMV